MDLELPNELFSNENVTKEGDKGDGILDVFDRYNFTVNEEEPLEKEVALDPELLGRIYEKLNAIREDNFEEYLKVLKSGKKGEEMKFNKEYGVYYTPREIVHYMCQESLIYYLDTEINGKVKKEDIEEFVRFADLFLEHEKTVIEKKEKIEKGEIKETSYEHEIPKSIIDNAKEIYDILTNIKICDPAVGSGAFPIGMMHEIVKLKRLLLKYIKKNISIYDLKRDIIKNSLYGVDIDPGAVEICKLRFWLSLVIEENENLFDKKDIMAINPLPNLDYKIMQGNSLISEFMGIDFDLNIEKLIQNDELNLEQDNINLLIQKLKEKKDEHLDKSNTRERKKLKEEIEELFIEIIKQKLLTYLKRLEYIKDKYKYILNIKERKKIIDKEEKALQQKMKLNDLKLFEKQLKEYNLENKVRLFFPWRLYFAEVFQEKGGFDILIANPPYGFLSGKESPIKKLEKLNRKDEVSFLKQYIKKLKSIYRKSSIGCLDWYKWFIERGYLLTKRNGYLVYITPNTYITLKKFKDIREILCKIMSNKIIVDLGFEIFDSPIVPVAICISQKAQPQNPIIYYSDIKKISKVLIKKSGIYNFIKNEINKVTLLNGDFKIYKHQIAEKLYLKFSNKLEEYLKISEGEHSLNNDFSKVTKKSSNSIPVIRDDLIEKFIYAPIDYLPQNYCKRYNKRLHSGERLFIRKTGDKIIVTLSPTHNLAIAHQNLYVGKCIKKGVNIKFIIALLSSKLLTFLYQFGPYGQKGRILAQFRIYGLYSLPLPKLENINSQIFIERVNEIFDTKKNKPQADTSQLEKEIDEMIYKLYNLTEEEIKIIEENT